MDNRTVNRMTRTRLTGRQTVRFIRRRVAPYMSPVTRCGCDVTEQRLGIGPKPRRRENGPNWRRHRRGTKGPHLSTEPGTRASLRYVCGMGGTWRSRGHQRAERSGWSKRFASDALGGRHPRKLERYIERSGQWSDGAQRCQRLRLRPPHPCTFGAGHGRTPSR
jgi:hypothetical protein